MKSLLIMRHGKSSWKDSSLPDHERPLKKRGRKDSAKIGERLKKKDLIPDLILSSSARRAAQTAEIVAKEMGYKGEIEYLDTLYMAEPETLFDVLRALPDVGSVMLVGHNPGSETLLQVLTDEITGLPTAALALVEIPIDAWEQINLDICGHLKHLWIPREID